MLHPKFKKKKKRRSVNVFSYLPPTLFHPKKMQEILKVKPIFALNT